MDAGQGAVPVDVVHADRILHQLSIGAVQVVGDGPVRLAHGEHERGRIGEHAALVADLTGQLATVADVVDLHHVSNPKKAYGKFTRVRSAPALSCRVSSSEDSSVSASAAPASTNCADPTLSSASVIAAPASDRRIAPARGTNAASALSTPIPA